MMIALIGVPAVAYLLWTRHARRVRLIAAARSWPLANRYRSPGWSPDRRPL